jgi:hypothetical protein
MFYRDRIFLFSRFHVSRNRQSRPTGWETPSVQTTCDGTEMSVVNTGNGPGVRMLTEVWYSKVSMCDSDCQHNTEQYGRGGTADIRNTNSVYNCCHQLLKSVGFQRKCRRSWQLAGGRRSWQRWHATVWMQRRAVLCCSFVMGRSVG